MRYASKQDLIRDIRTSHDSLRALVAGIPKTRHVEKGVWGDGWSLSDLMAHLAEWQRMFLGWHEDGLRGESPRLPAPGYKWNETPKLNRAIWEKHRHRSPSAVMRDFEAGYRRILETVEGLSSEQLFEPGHFSWTRNHGLSTYLGANTASHYRFAIKVIKRWLSGR